MVDNVERRIRSEILPVVEDFWLYISAGGRWVLFNSDVGEACSSVNMSTPGLGQLDRSRRGGSSGSR